MSEGFERMSRIESDTKDTDMAFGIYRESLEKEKVLVKNTSMLLDFRTCLGWLEDMDRDLALHRIYGIFPCCFA